MSLPTAAPTVPIAVLVLAWDETTPAVRALVEATQTTAPSVESMLVLVPQAAPAVLSAEEYLPLPPASNLTPGLAAPAEAPRPSEPSDQAVRTSPVLAAAGAIAAGAAHEQAAPMSALPAHRPPPAEPLAPAPALRWSAVRVLRLSSLSLPELSQRAGQLLPAPPWLGPAMVPAAPYQGSRSLPGPAPIIAGPATSAASSPAATMEAATVEDALPAAAPLPPPPTYPPAEPLAQAADLEGDLLPPETDDLAGFERGSVELPPTSETALSPTLPAWVGGWPEALAALGPAQLPASAELSEPAPPTPPAAAHGLPAPPASQQYAAPDLNFKVIQYARFAVPAALAEEPYAAIYAPAWPTWLAAQELRQRTNWPLVLHVATLPAEPLATATGWVAELQRQALRRADLVLAETPTLAQRLRHELALPPATVHTVPAADAAAVAQALHAARLRPAASIA